MAKNNRDRMPDLAFRIMSAIIALQELFPRRIDTRVLGFGIQKGQTVVDYGCGPGRYTVRFAKLVGEHGRVYAVDVQELAIESVKRKMDSQGLKNIVPIVARGYETGIPDHSADIVLALDMFFLVKDPSALLSEIRRILRADGLLILDDGHKSRKSTLEKIDQAGSWIIKESGRHHLRCIPK
jgi:ubiquinone/menaquinone biosynthesis C-methylase UbiE